MKQLTTQPHVIKHVDPSNHAKVLRVEHTFQHLAPSADRLTTVDELRSCDNLAVVRRAGLGDCLMLQPALRALHQALPKLEIDLFVPGRWIPVLLGMPHLRDVRDASCLRPEAYDRVVDCSVFPERHPLRYELDRPSIFARAFGLGLGDGTVEVKVDVDRIDEARMWLEDLERPLIGLCPWAARAQSDWPHAERFGALFKRTYPGSLILLTDRSTTLPCADKTTTDMPLTLLTAVLHELDLLVTTDTGTMHLAFACGTRFVACLFGVSAARLRIPWQSNYWAYDPRHLDCHPCDMGPHAFTCRRECMRSATPELVLKAVKPFMGMLRGGASTGISATGGRNDVAT